MFIHVKRSEIMKPRSLPKTAAAAGDKSTAAPASKSAARRPSKKSTVETSGNGANGNNGHVIASLDDNVMVTSSPQESEIAARAYQIWVNNGCLDGCDEENWHQAQRELSGRGPAA